MLRGALIGARMYLLARSTGRYTCSPAFALIVVETTDLVFAMDSIPAVFAVTRKPFLVYTSNVFAMLGLRSLYFVLAGAVERFRYLRFGLAAVLAFVGAKMLLGDVIEFPTWISLAVIAGALALAVAVSVTASAGLPWTGSSRIRGGGQTVKTILRIDPGS